MTNPENYTVRLSGDVYIQRLGATEQPVIGPLPAEVFGVQASAKITDVKDTRRGRRGQRLVAVPDPEPATGSLTLLAVPPRMLAMLALGSETTVSQAAGTVTGEQHSFVAGYGVQLDHVNVGNVVVTAGLDATLGTGVEGSNTGLTWTAVAPGTGGNAITVALIDPGANNAALAVTVVGTAITVSLATGVAGAITSTAAQVRAAVIASAAAAALVSVAHTGTSTGAGTVVAVTATHLAGGSTAGTAYTAGTDYEVVDAEEGIIRPIEGGTMGASGTAFFAYSHGAVSGLGVVWGTEAVVRTRIKLVGTNDASEDGETIKWAAPSVLMTPDGEVDLMAGEPIKAKFKLAPETVSGASGPATLSWPVFGAV